MIKFRGDKIPIRFLCRYFLVSPISYYFWKKNNICKRLESKERINALIKEIFKESKYNGPMVYQIKSNGEYEYLSSIISGREDYHDVIVKDDLILLSTNKSVLALTYEYGKNLKKVFTTKIADYSKPFLLDTKFYLHDKGVILDLGYSDGSSRSL